MSNVFTRNFNPVFRGTWSSSFESAYDPAALQLFSRMTTAPSAGRRTLINNLISVLKADGVWFKLDALWVPAAETSQAASLNWISTSYTLTPINSPAFTADRGYLPDGATSYLDTGFISSAASDMTLNNAHVGIYLNTSGGASAARVDIGAQDATALTVLKAFDSANTISFRLNSSLGGSSNSAAFVDARGHTVLSRTASNLTSPYRNATATPTSSVVSVALPTTAMFLGANNGSGTPNQFSNRRIAAAHVGASLTAADVADVYNALNSYLSAIGAA